MIIKVYLNEDDIAVINHLNAVRKPTGPSVIVRVDTSILNASIGVGEEGRYND
jgi:hypothetical protein